MANLPGPDSSPRNFFYDGAGRAIIDDSTAAGLVLSFYAALEAGDRQALNADANELLVSLAQTGNWAAVVRIPRRTDT